MGLYWVEVRTAAWLLALAGLLLAQETGTIEGRVLKGDGKPWAGAQVVAFGVSEKEVSRHITETGAEGGFRFEGLKPGRYVLSVRPKPKPKKRAGRDLESVLGEAIGKAIKEELFEGLEKVLAKKNADGAAHVVELKAGAVVRHDIRLPPEVPVDGKVIWMGKPVVGAVVRFVPLNKRGRPSWSRGRRKVEPRTDREGWFDAGRIPAGDYALIIKIGSREVLPGSQDVAGTEAHLPIVLGSHTIRIKIEDSRGQPVRKAEFGAFEIGQHGNWGWGVRTRDMREEASRTGIYELPYIVAGRWHAYTNVASAHVAEMVEVGPTAPEPLVVLRLPPTGTLVVRAVDPQGRPVRNVHIRIVHPSGIPGYGFPTDEKGEMRRELRAEVWHVGRTARMGLGFEGQPLEIKVKAHAETVVEFTVRREDYEER